MPLQTNNRITAGNSTRRYEGDDPEYWDLLDIHHQEDDRTRALTSQLQQAARANRQQLASLSAAAAATVATNATSTRAHAQQARLAIEEPKPKKFLHSIVINKLRSCSNRPPTPIANHIPLNLLWASETCPVRSFPFAGPSQHSDTTSLMQELSAEDLRSDEEPEREEEDMADEGEDGEQKGMEEWGRGGSLLIAAYILCPSLS